MSSSDNNFTSLNIEKHCLAALIKHPEIIPDIMPFVESKHFASEEHGVIYGAIKSLYGVEKDIDLVILIERIKNLGISFREHIDISDYVDALYHLSSLQKEKAPEYFKELHKLAIARKICDAADEVKRGLKKDLNEPLATLVSNAEKKIINVVTEHVEDSYSPIDIYSEMEPQVEGAGEEEREDGIILPYPQYTRWYGGATEGDLKLVAAPAGGGKSTYLVETSTGAAALEQNNCRVLYLDTEMETKRVINRMVAGQSGVGEYYIRTGRWRKNAEMVEKVRAVWPRIKHMMEKVDHIYVANKPIDDIISIIRRWRVNNVKEGQKPFIVYDYLKLTGEKPSEFWKEYQIMGQKCDTLKHLGSEVGATVMAAVQTNSAGDVSMAQQLKWFASQVFVLTPKTVDEIAEHGEEFGTHSLRAIKTRNQGEDAQGFFKFFSITDDNGNTRWEENYLNFDFTNFKVRECGTYEEILRRDAGQLDTEEDESDDMQL